MKHIRLIFAAAALVLVSAPAFAVFNGYDLGHTINSLKNELKLDYEKRVASENMFDNQYRSQRRDMVSIMKKCNKLSLMLYSQKQDFTFDITYAFRSVTDEYVSFKSKQLPYDKIADRLDWDIDRYARLLEALRRLPPALESIDVIPDSLAYHNDSLDFRPSRRFTPGQGPRGLAASMGLHHSGDSTARRRPYILSDEEQLDRDSCIYYASEMLKMCVSRKDRVIADSTYYHRTFLRLKESYDYAQEKYKILQDLIFVQGQTPYHRIIAHFGMVWKMAVDDCREKSGRERTPNVYGADNEPVESLVWLIVAIVASLLIRLLRRGSLKDGILLYLPLMVSATAILLFRITFLPNSMVNILLPPILLASLVWQFVACLRHGAALPVTDRIIGWLSVIVMILSLVISWVGFVFVGLIVMVWWFMQVSAALTIVTVLHLLDLVKEKVLRKRVAHYRNSLTYLPAEDRNGMLFGITWPYELVRDVIVPLAVILSVPLCLRTALNIFDFSDLYHNIVYNPFVNLTDTDGNTVLTISFYGILVSAGLFFIFRYIDKAVNYIYKSLRYASYLKKSGRTAIRSNEINLSLAKSIISTLVWFVYVIIIVVMLKIPTSSLTIIAGGLSAGIGIAMKDIINNFVYGIQLMSGRIRVGDWIECDGVRGKVTSISYQSTQIETLEGAVMSFLNSSLFSGNFRNLTRNHAYELLKITVGVSYGTDVAKVRSVLMDAMQQLRAKDAYGTEIVDPKKGVSVTFDAFDDSSVNVAVKQYVLVAERVAYSDRAREVIYNALNEAGIQIPFPQRDIHIIGE